MTRDDEDIMRLRKAFAEPAIEIEGCPEPDRIWSAVRGELPADELRETLEHVALCASCAEDWRIAMAFEEEARKGELAPVVLFHRYRPWVAAAAAALVLTVVGIRIRDIQGPDRNEPQWRGAETEIQPAISRGTPLQRRACVLAWKPVEGAESYNLAVTTDTLIVIANQTGLTTSSYRIPPGDLARFPAGTMLQWTVTAYDAEGGKISSSTFLNPLQ